MKLKEALEHLETSNKAIPLMSFTGLHDSVIFIDGIEMFELDYSIDDRKAIQVILQEMNNNDGSFDKEAFLKENSKRELPYTEMAKKRFEMYNKSFKPSGEIVSLSKRANALIAYSDPSQLEAEYNEDSAKLFLNNLIDSFCPIHFKGNGRFIGKNTSIECTCKKTKPKEL